MADEQDISEALDDDKWDDVEEERPAVELIDQTADADPGIGSDELDAGESGSSIDGVLAEDDPDDDPLYSDLVPAAPEEAAMHVVDEP